MISPLLLEITQKIPLSVLVEEIESPTIAKAGNHIAIFYEIRIKSPDEEIVSKRILSILYSIGMVGYVVDHKRNEHVIEGVFREWIVEESKKSKHWTTEKGYRKWRDSL